MIDHKTFVFLGDGCLMEGISHEACSLASLWGLSKLICFYDSNGISIDGKADPWFNENVKQRFNAYGWNVIGPIDGHDFGEISKSISNALEHSTHRPGISNYGVCPHGGVHLGAFGRAAPPRSGVSGL